MRWEHLLASPLNEERFHAACTVIDQQEEYDAATAMKYTNQLIDIVRPINHREWMHALLTNKYELVQLVYSFLDSASTLAGALRKNAENHHDRIFREAIVYSVHACMQSDNADLAKKFIETGVQACEEARDSLNLAMLYLFKGELLFKGSPETSIQALAFAQQAKEISRDLTNKTPYFASAYLAAHIAYVNNPSKLVEALERLIPLSKDSSLIKQDFYTQTFFAFGKPSFTIYLDLMRLNLVLMDIPSARRIYQLIEASLVARKRKTGILSDRSLGMLVSDRAVIEAFAGDKLLTAKLLDSCRRYFAGVPEAEIPSVNYFLARALWNEMDQQYPTMLNSVRILQSKYVGAFLPLSLTTLFARAYALNGDDERARRYFDRAVEDLASKEYSAAGYYHFQYYAEWLYNKGDYLAYANSLRKFYSIKDSIASIHQMRHIKDVQAQRYVKERDLEIAYLRKIQESDHKMNQLIWGGVLTILAALTVAIALLYSRNLQRRRSNAILQGKNQRI